MANTDTLVAILEDLRASVSANKSGAVTIEPKASESTPKQLQDAVEQNAALDDPPWVDDFEVEQSTEILTLPAPKKELIFLPLSVQSSWMARRGSPETYIRKFKSSTIITSQGYTPSGRPIGLPSGLMSRRILISLITQATMNQSPVVQIPSIKQLLGWSGLQMTGRSHKSCQRNLFQMAMMNLDLWFQPNDRKATIYKGHIFDKIEVTIEQGKQQQFSFIPNEVVFDESFYQTIIKNKAVPYIRDAVMKASSPYEHDLIMWLFQRQSSDYLTRPVFLNYFLMQEQFGTNPNENPALFRHRFKKEIRNVIKKHDREITVGKNGITLHPMKAMVPYKRNTKRNKFY